MYFLGARLGNSFCYDFLSHYGSFLCRYGAFRIFDGPEYTPPSFLSTYFIFLDARFFVLLFHLPTLFSSFVSRFMTTRARARLLRLTMFTI